MTEMKAFRLERGVQMPEKDKVLIEYIENARERDYSLAHYLETIDHLTRTNVIYVFNLRVGSGA